LLYFARKQLTNIHEMTPAIPEQLATKSFIEIRAQLLSYKQLLYHKYNVSSDSELLSAITNEDFYVWEKIDGNIEFIQHIQQYLQRSE